MSCVRIFIKKSIVKRFGFPYFRSQLHRMVQGKTVFCPLFTGQTNKNKPNNIGGTR